MFHSISSSDPCIRSSRAQASSLNPRHVENVGVAARTAAITNPNRLTISHSEGSPIPTLPDFSALGGSPSGNTGRVSVAYDSTVAAGRENAATAAQAGAGLKAFGQGLTSVARAGLDWAEDQRKKTDVLDVARAGSSWLTSRADLDASARDEQDQNVLREQYPDKYQKALDGAASLIQSDEARQKFLLSNQIHVKQAQIAASARADDLHRDAFTADVYRQSNGLLTAGLKAPDDATRASIIAQHGKLIDGMAENGYISRAAAEKQKNDWANSFSQSALSMMPAGQRLVALGAARDPLSFAKAFGGATEDSHAEVLTDFFRKTCGQAIDPREVA